MNPKQISQVAALLLATLLAGCATTREGADRLRVDTVARSEHFALVRLRAGQTFEDVAEAMLGTPSAAWQLREANANGEASPGRLLAVPLRPLNPSSVYPGGYRSLPILCYHQFTDAPRASHRLELTAAAFEAQLRYLRERNYHILSLAEVGAILDNGQPIPPRAVVLTIDDGYRSVYETAWPLLQKYRAPASLFIYNDFIGGGSALSWAQIREMRDSGLVEIGSHGKSHSSLSRLPTDNSDADYQRRVAAELSGSERSFQDHLGEVPRYLSYPYGNSSRQAVQWLRASGYRLATTVTRGENPAYANPLLLHRTMIYSDHDLDDFARFVDGFQAEASR